MKFAAVILGAVLLASGMTTSSLASQRRADLNFGRKQASLPRRSRAAAAQKRTDAGTLLVHMRRGTSSAGAEDVVRDAGAKSERHIEALGVEVVSVKGESRYGVGSRLRNDPRVDRVESNPIRYAADDPDDEYYPSQSNLFASRLPAAWDVTHGISTHDIAILDSGVDLDHPDLAPRIVGGYDFVNNDTNPQDDFGHGTLVAGVAAADSDNIKGIAGAAWDARIMPVKVLGSDGSGTDADVAQGIIWATEHGAEVINMSFGAPDSSETLSDAVDYAISQGIVVVAAAGNEATDVPSYPAAYPAVISVGATDEYGDVVAFSNRGTTLDVVAPGWNVVSTDLGVGPVEAYAMGSGTSFAAPLVSGVAAMVVAKNPTFTPAQIQTRFRNSAIDRGPAGIDNYYGWGLVDAYGAVGGRTAAAPPPAAGNNGADSDTAAGSRHASGEATISPEGDVDWFRFDAEGSGTITVTVTPPASDNGQGAKTFDPIITAWSQVLEAMGEFNATGPGAVEVAQIDVAAAGRYRFRVVNAASSRSSGTRTAPDPYTISSSFIPIAVSESTGGKLWVSDITPSPFNPFALTSAHPAITFGRELQPASVTSTTVRLIDARSNVAVTASRSYDAVIDQVTITPSTPLVAGRTYVVRVSGLTDTDTNVMDETFESRFTVSAPQVPRDIVPDFNKDGFEDMVIAAPDEDHGVKTDGGVVHVLYGKGFRLSGVKSQMWSQDTPGIAGSVEKGDRFGAAVASGDLNNDGYDDLVVGVPNEDLAVADAGVIHVIRGSSSGLTATGSQLWSQDSSGIPGTAEAGDRFGASLATGAFDAIAGDEVAVGVPNEGVGSRAKAGAVYSLRGAPSGLTATGAIFWTQDSPGIEFFAEAGDGFGTSLVAGDFQGDGNDDLAIGTPFDSVTGTDTREGSVSLMRGSIVGLRPAGLVVDAFESDDIETGDAFGASLEIADLSDDPYDELIIGVPGEDGLLAANVGLVHIIYSDHSEPWVSHEVIDPASGDEANARFGSVLSSRNDYLAVGVPDDDVSSKADAGSVYLIRGGYVTQITQSYPGAGDPPEAGDRFGASISMHDFDGDSQPDLLIGAPSEVINGRSAAGEVYLIQESDDDPDAAVLITQDTGDIGSAVEAGDRFGASVL